MFQLLPYSSLMRRLAQRPFPPHVNFVALYSDHDWMCPARFARAVGPDGIEIARHYELKGIGHNDFLFKKAPYKLIRKILFGLPVDAGCAEPREEAG